MKPKHESQFTQSIKSKGYIKNYCAGLHPWTQQKPDPDSQLQPCSRFSSLIQRASKTSVKCQNF